MRILVAGAYGLIGSAVLARLHRDGHELVGAGRSIVEARRCFSFARWIEADFRKLGGIDAWRPLLEDVDAVVNCVGVLQDGAGDDTRRVHVTATCALFDACLRLGIRRVVHISAMGVGAAGPSEFSRTKAEADRHLQNLDLDWVILRPGMVLAPAVYGGTALLRGIAAFPGVTPLVLADARIQVVGIDDVVETIARCLAPGAPRQVNWELAHPQVLTLAEIVVAMRQWLGFSPRRLLRLPPGAGRVIAAVADMLGRLGWRSPARSTSLAQLAAGATGDPGPWMAATGIRPASLADIFAARPASVQDRWFARLYLVKPLAIGGLAFSAILSGLVTLRSLSGTTQLPRAVGSESDLATGVTTALVVAGAVINIVLGLGALVRSTARGALVGMLVVTMGTAALKALMIAGYASQLWLEYLAIVVAVTPIILATLFTLAILDDR